MTKRAPCRAGLCGDDRGSALLEITISVWMLMFVTFLIFEFCMLIYTYSVLGNAAREAVRYAVVHGTTSSSCSGPSSGCGDSSGSNVRAVASGYAEVSFHDTRAMNISPSWPDGKSTPGSRVVVAITYPYISYLHLPGFTSPTMTMRAEGRIVF
ncbi:MAG TPA: TadE/TadG family type IV pilus assembly protein [Pirellulales bacterium]